MAFTRVFITTVGAGTWTVPADFSSSNTIECIGGGDFGRSATEGSFGGAGGDYAKISNLSLTPGGSVNFTVGKGKVNGDAASAGDTWFNGTTALNASVTAKGGGSSSANVGTVTYTGGTTGSGTGGGGGAGPNGNGGNATLSGGQGGNGSGGAGGTTGDPGNPGSNGTEWDASHGSGGGGGYGNSSNAISAPGGNGGLYGGGGGGSVYTGQYSSGGQGLIVVTYYSSTMNCYWVGGTGNWDATTQTHWADASGGTGGTAPVPTSTNNVFFDGNSGSGTTTITAAANTANLTCTGFTGTLAGSSALNVYGSLLLVAGLTFTHSGTITFGATASGKTITTAGKTLGALVFNGSGGGWTLQDNVTCPSVTMTLGTLNLSSVTITITGTGTAWSATGGTIIGGTSTIKFTDASSSAKTFAGGGLSYGNLWLTGSGTGAYTISGSNTFLDFKVDTPPHTINFTAFTTQTLASFTVSGTAGNLMTLQSTTAGYPWYLRKNTAGAVVCDYLAIQDSNVLTL